MQVGYHVHHPVIDLMMVVYMLFATRAQLNGFQPVMWRGYCLIKQTNSRIKIYSVGETTQTFVFMTVPHGFVSSLSFTSA